MRLKTKLGLLAGVAVVAAGGGCIVSATQDADWLRTRVVSAVEKKTGRHLTIDQLHVWLLPFPWIEARGVHLSGAPGGEVHDMLSADSVRVRLAVLPLFQHRIELSNVSFSKPSIDLHRFEDGQADWLFTPQQTAQAGGSSFSPGGRVHWNIEVSNVQMYQGNIVWQDDVRHRSGELPVETFEASALNGESPVFHLISVKNKGTLSVEGQTGHLFPYPAAQMPVQLKIALSSGGQSAGLAHVDGTVTVAPEPEQSEYVLRFGGSLGQLQTLQLFFPRAALPQGENISVNGVVGGKGVNPQVQSIHIHTGRLDLSQYGKNVVLDHLSVDAPQADSKLAVDLAGKIGDSSLGLKGTTGTFDQIETLLHSPEDGSVPVDLTLTNGGAGVHVVGSLSAKHSELDIQGQLSHLDEGSELPVVESLSVQGHAQSEQTQALVKAFNFENAIKNIAFTADLKAGRVTWSGQSWTDFSAHLVNDGARLVADPVQANGSGVKQSARFVYDISSSNPSYEVAAHPAVLPLRFVDNWMGVDSWLKGTAFLVGAVSVQGRDISAWRQTAAGHLGISVVDGKVSSKILSSLIQHPLPTERDVAVRCFGSHMQFADGVATIDLLGLQSQFLSLHGHGAVNLLNTALNLHLAPAFTLAGNTAESAVEVTGTSQSPVIKMEADTSGRYGLTIGKSDGAEDSCPSLLSAAREGVPGPEAAAPVHEKGGKVMNMLRGLGLFH